MWFSSDLSEWPSALELLARSRCQGLRCSGVGGTASSCRKAVWPRRAQRSTVHRCGAAAAAELTPNVSRPLHVESDTQRRWLVLKSFVTQAEREELLASAMKQKVQGMLLPNPAGPHRFFRRLDPTGGVDDLIEALTDRLQSAVLGLANRPRDTTLGRVCSYIEPGGFIHEHKDRYPESSGLQGLGHLRANIVVQLEPSGEPVIAGDTLPVVECDAWVFLASHELHATATVQGSKPRIVYGFGWTVPGDFRLEPVMPDHHSS
eukprot:TRINITY_DN81034_c0_g1_i1.p1 TRINITY_DN81034_c0_g1~~TRINITY_DN81034_c0_g1_i1.p1  ORF type:complete len:262 (-),score=43.75 TRINITY_DN81034_c0_g1_i1:11-796(-)